jgi:hypothetical protein
MVRHRLLPRIFHFAHLLHAAASFLHAPSARSRTTCISRKAAASALLRLRRISSFLYCTCASCSCRAVTLLLSSDISRLLILPRFSRTALHVFAASFTPTGSACIAAAVAGSRLHRTLTITRRTYRERLRLW